MNPAHTAPPMLCSACVIVVHSRIPPGSRACNLIYPCRHQPGGVVVGTAFVIDGTIREWTIAGPMTEQRAEAMALQFLNANQAAGGHTQEFNAHRSSRYN
jgi:hypothetical protein